MKIATHCHVDTDNICSLLLAEFTNGALDVRFVGAGMTDEELLDGERPLDIASGKGDLSCFGSMPESVSAPQGLIDEINEQDSTGLVVSPQFSIPELVAATRSFYHARGIKGENQDRAMIDAWRPLVHGLLLVEKERRKVEKTAKDFTIQRAAGKRWVVGERSLSPMEGKYFQKERACVGAIFHDGHNLGIFRFPGCDEPNLKELEGHLPDGWFCHNAGFLCAWGSRKNPAIKRAPLDGPQDKGDLLDLIDKVFG